MQAREHLALRGAIPLAFFDVPLLAPELFAEGLLLAQLVLVQVAVALELWQEASVAFLPPFVCVFVRRRRRRGRARGGEGAEAWTRDLLLRQRYDLDALDYAFVYSKWITLHDIPSGESRAVYVWYVELLSTGLTCDLLRYTHKSKP